jgi:hypothetical protein
VLRIILPLVVVVAAFGVWDNVEARRFERARAPFDVAEPPRLTALPAEDDAGRYYAAAAIAAVGLSEPPAAIYEVLRHQRNDLARVAASTPDDLRRRDLLLRHGAPSIRLIEEGAGLPLQGFALQLDFNYRFTGLIRAGGLAALGTLSRLDEGDTEGAVRSLISRVRFLRVFADGYGVTERARQVREIAGDVGLVLGSKTLADVQIESLDRELAIVDIADSLTASIAGNARMQAQMPRTSSMTVIFLRPIILRRSSQMLEAIAQAVPLAVLPWPQRLRAMKTLKEPRVATLLQNVTTDTASAVALLRSARVALAIERYRRAHGALPATLEALALPSELTQDPFTGEPLRYEQRADHFVVSSAGFNDANQIGGVAGEKEPGSGNLGVRVGRSG